MHLQFTEEQEMMRRMVRDFAREVIAPQVEKMEETDEFPLELIRKMGEYGLMGIPVAEEWGGSAADFVSYIIAIHEISKVSPTVGVILSVHTSVGTNPILYFGSEEQKKKYVPKLASGQYIGAFALTEPNAGSDAASIRTSAVKKGDKYILNGSKIFITNGGVADTYITFAVTDPSKGPKGISAFIVEKDTPGFQVGKKEKKMGLQGSNTTELIFDNAEVPAENLLGEEGMGFTIAMANLDVGRIGIAAQGLGIAEGAFEHALAYAKERHQFGKPIAAQQAIAFKLADMATQIEASRMLVYRAASLRNQGIKCGMEASMAKRFATDTAMKVATEAVQIFGGYGYTREYPVERYFRDAKVTQIYEGTNQIQRIVISKHLLNK
ncbi:MULTISPECIES: acyl-CoA dehydrogenase [Aneurinibacillus]|uniref:Acyl-CoA dehydrogenase n=1 Tax=Aneurinibacillus thermoaerophilus TaxID=143495 RepID=A0A1G8DSL9_ANETH|nr:MULTISPECIES: acyl-CoA dehydrogenase [Aneurinibacillus]AMA71602.1 acyl-CoA dehydrogenase [Aneurinibacillus sp. XH2]MED0681163.1 acyl-CoA dehydrogenase [Aneurinibacillus thermoaerophilus]MED0735718.1 acyl-CoA dehydrogenase [Aneurinibacillus thermoaerophilus]MED0757581.1 acyl-CoA dehydrogenase [Aneurinibacillus thermoaerophilus]MED0759220.1 acyl-CoA dehydrogenase [Aneurinibacillus thermoaerophilus]